MIGSGELSIFSLGAAHPPRHRARRPAAADGDILLTAHIFLDTYLLRGSRQAALVDLAAACERLVLSLTTVFNDTCV